MKKHPIDDVFDRVADYREQWLLKQAEQEKGAPWQAQPLTDVQHVAWFEKKLAEYPPEPWITPEGEQVMVSPWLAHLRYVEDGEKEARRYIRTKMRQATSGYEEAA